MNREKNYDLLRGISCISIVLLHIAALYTEQESIYSSYSNLEFSICDFLQIITRTAVPCFVMLSGAFMLDRKKLNVLSFYKKSFFKLGIPTLVFSLLYILVRIISNHGIKTVIIETLNGKPIGHMWYMFMLAGLYLVYPFVYYFKEAVSDRTFIVYTIIAVVLSSTIHFTCHLIWPIWFLEYIGYFMAGYCIKVFSQHILIRWQIIIVLSIVFLMASFVLNEMSFYGGYYSSDFFRNPSFPTIIVASLLWFTAFSKIKIKKISQTTQMIVNSSMIIYMVHPLIFGIINKLLIGRVFTEFPSPYWYVPALFVVCFIISVAVSVVYIKISSYLSSKLFARK